jgi:RNA polymerase sigma-70 factor (ECF subfamily)
LISNLPDRCKSVFRARRVHGMSQNETAQTLGLSDSVVEHEMMRGMRLMSEMISRHGMERTNQDKDEQCQRLITKPSHGS